jgi:hypothetical protein
MPLLLCKTRNHIFAARSKDRMGRLLAYFVQLWLAWSVIYTWYVTVPTPGHLRVRRYSVYYMHEVLLDIFIGGQPTYLR